MLLSYKAVDMKKVKVVYHKGQKRDIAQEGLLGHFVRGLLFGAAVGYVLTSPKSKEWKKKIEEKCDRFLETMIA